MNSAIIVAAGQGTRMGSGQDKLFLEVAGRPVIAHSWGAFDAADRIDEIVVVVRDGLQNAFQTLAAECKFAKPFRLVPGGAARQDSVWNGLQAINGAAELVAIHDGARPCVSQGLIQAVLLAAAAEGAAVAARKVTDTIKESNGGQTIARTVDRARLWSVQTPQAFRVEVIRRALAAARQQGLSLTDDTAACELIGQPVSLVESAELNPKVTVRADLPLVAALLSRSPQPQTA